MFPSNFTEPIYTTDGVTDTGIDFVFDYETGQHILKNAVLGECSQLETAQQYIQNVLRTWVNKFKVYTLEETEAFGLSIYEYIGKRNLPMGYLNSEMKREVTEQLLKHPLIAAVSDWKGKREKQGLDISFTVTMADGVIITVDKTITAYNTG